MSIVEEMLTTVDISGFIPCKSCSNILTKECFDDCIHRGDFKHYRQRPGTDIKDLPPFPINEVLEETGRNRLVAMCIYMTAVVDFLQHMDEYEKIREYYKKGQLEDFSI
jgi:hypothetical protein